LLFILFVYFSSKIKKRKKNILRKLLTMLTMSDKILWKIILWR